MFFSHIFIIVINLLIRGKLEDLNLGLLNGDPMMYLEINNPYLWLGGPSYGLRLGVWNPLYSVGNSAKNLRT